MAVYLPAAVVGNQRVLVTLGYRGEVMSFCWPRLDYAQHAHEVMMGVWLEDAHAFKWLFEPEFSSRVRYLPGTNIFETTVEGLGLELTFTDFCPPGAPVLVRQVRARNLASTRRYFRLFGYFDFWCGEVSEKNWVYYRTASNTFVQRFRNFCLVVGGSTFNQFTCGKAPGANAFSCKDDLADGKLNSQVEDLGDVAFAAGWDFALEPGGETSRLMLLAAGFDEATTLERVATFCNQPQDQLVAETAAYWHARSLKPAPEELPAPLKERYQRANLALPLLCDAATGGILAAPEFDPRYEKSGGYGYCWPRDASEVAARLAELGEFETAERFFDWARATQRRDGGFEQRYWLDGLPAASWCSREGTQQVDESAAVVLAFGRVLAKLPPEAQQTWLARHFAFILNTFGYLQDQLTKGGGLHAEATDLWETFHGTFTYTNALIAGALATGGRLAQLAAQEKLASGLARQAEDLKRLVLEKFWTGEYFARGLRPDGTLDVTVDASVLGLVSPSGLVDFTQAEELQRLESTLEVMEARLAVEEAPDCIGLKRFEGDSYLGGPVGVVNTAWAAEVLLKLALYFVSLAPAKAADYAGRARAHLNYCARHANAAGLIPEDVGPTFDTAVWAAPHGWTTALFGKACELLAEYERARHRLQGLVN